MEWLQASVAQDSLLEHLCWSVFILYMMLHLMLHRINLKIKHISDSSNLFWNFFFLTWYYNPKISDWYAVTFCYLCIISACSCDVEIIVTPPDELKVTMTLEDAKIKLDSLIYQIEQIQVHVYNTWTLHMKWYMLIQIKMPLKIN